MTPARPLAASVAALGIAVFAVPLPASAAARPALAAPDTCAGAERYAAQSGAEVIRVEKLSVRAAKEPPHGGRGRSADDNKTGTAPVQSAAGAGKAAVSGSGTGKSKTAGGGGRGATDATTSADKSRTGDASGSPASEHADNGKPGAADTGTDAAGAHNGKPGAADTGPDRAGADNGQPGAAETGPDAAGASKATAGEEANSGGAGEALKPLPGKSLPAGGLRVGEAKSALVAAAGAPNAAAVSRMLNTAEESVLNKALIQQAPPSTARPARRKTPAAAAGPLLVDAGSLTAGAQWQGGMACGAAYGEVTRAATTLGAATVSGDGDAALVAVPEKLGSSSTTALERASRGARSVAEATIAVRTFELLDGAVLVKVLRAPTLRTAMSIVEGGEVRYRPAAIEISGAGIKTTKLDAAGDSMELTFDERQTESLRLPRLSGDSSSDLPLPSIPGLPPVGDEGEPESVPAPGSGTSVKISLGDVRQATVDHAVAAKATAIKVGIAQRGGDDGYGKGADVTLDLGIGVLESAAVSPEAAGAGVSDAVAGAGGSLPITGPRVDVMLMAGGALLVGGAGALAFGMRRRRFDA